MDKKQIKYTNNDIVGIVRNWGNLIFFTLIFYLSGIFVVLVAIITLLVPEDYFSAITSTFLKIGSFYLTFIVFISGAAVFYILVRRIINWK